MPASYYAWLRQVLLGEGMGVSYSERGTRGNPGIESLWGRPGTELGSRIDQAPSLPALREVISDHLRYYNTGATPFQYRERPAPRVAYHNRSPEQT